MIEYILQNTANISYGGEVHKVDVIYIKDITPDGYKKSEDLIRYYNRIGVEVAKFTAGMPQSDKSDTEAESKAEDLLLLLSICPDDKLVQDFKDCLSYLLCKYCSPLAEGNTVLSQSSYNNLAYVDKKGLENAFFLSIKKVFGF